MRTVEASARGVCVCTVSTAPSLSELVKSKKKEKKEKITLKRCTREHTDRGGHGCLVVHQRTEGETVVDSVEKNKTNIFVGKEGCCNLLIRVRDLGDTRCEYSTMPHPK